MVMRLHFLLAVLTHYAHKLRSAPSTPAPHYNGAAPLTTLPDPRTVHFHAHPHPLLPRAPLAQRRRVHPRAVGTDPRCCRRQVGPPRGEGGGKHRRRDGCVGVRYAPERGVLGVCGRGGTTAGTCARARNRDSRDSREGRESRERRESTEGGREAAARGRHARETGVALIRIISPSSLILLIHVDLVSTRRPVIPATCPLHPLIHTAPVYHIHTLLAHTYDLPACTYLHPPSLVLSYT
ncbi:hypothetical protein C8J57DRAFT_57917 [Mycena rebaudengoi]|nr:hypothetical protein C8J57DRAFT_57917 [Mycena rebaudengoi]